MFRIPGWSWWPDEQPSTEVKARVESKLEQLGWKVDIVLSHTVPLKCEPTEAFMSGIDQSKVDKSTEAWLDTLEKRLDYRKWYCGHYHTVKCIDRLWLMFDDYDVLDAQQHKSAKISFFVLEKISFFVLDLLRQRDIRCIMSVIILLNIWEVKYMAAYYNKLWKLLIDKDMKKKSCRSQQESVPG